MTEPSAHLLLVDDDARIRDLLGQYLTRQGFLATGARDAGHARKLLAGLEFDLIVLDVMMPGDDGLALTRELRAGGLPTPILLLTARGETQDRISGLEAGADDYLAKPFEPRELLLRINAILRRVPDQPAAPALTPLALGPLRFDPERGQLWNGAEQIRLTATEARLMQILAQSPGAPVARAELVQRLGRADGQAQERAVDVQITRLRRKIEHDPRNPRHLQTVRGEGYMLLPD